MDAAVVSAAEAAEAEATAAAAEAAAVAAAEDVERLAISWPPPEAWDQMDQDDRDWICIECGRLNTEENEVCLSCGAAMPEEAKAEGWSCPKCTFDNPLENAACASCGAPSPLAEENAAEEEEEVGIWVCPRCQLQNRLDEFECFCGEPQPEDAMPEASSSLLRPGSPRRHRAGSPMAPSTSDDRLVEFEDAAAAEAAGEEENEEDGDAIVKESSSVREERERRARVAELYGALLAEAESPLEVAALGKLRAWEFADCEFSLAEVMDVVRFVEAQLYPEVPEPRLTRPKRRVCLSAAGLCVALLMGCATSLAYFVARVVTAQESGLLDATGGGGRGGLAAVGLAVRLHGLLSYPSLPEEELRLARDVVLRHDSAFHFYRVASVSRSFSGGVRMEMEDGSYVRVEGDQVFLRRRWESEVIADMTGQGPQDASWDNAGAFYAYAPFWRGSDSAALPRPPTTTPSPPPSAGAGNATGGAGGDPVA